MRMLPLFSYNTALDRSCVGVDASAGFTKSLQLCVGVDAHIDPAERTVYTEIPGEFATFSRGDVGIAPYEHSGETCVLIFPPAAY